MNKKKFFIIAILLFLGLGTFVFANPDEEILEENIEKTSTDNISNTTNDYNENRYNTYKNGNVDINDLNSEDSINNNSTVINNGNLQNNTTNSSDAGSTNNGIANFPIDSNTGQNGSSDNNFTNGGNNDDVNNGNNGGSTNPTPPDAQNPPVENETTDDVITKLVLNLQQQVFNAKNKIDIIKAKEYRDVNAIAQKIEEVLDINVKSQLQVVFSEINKILDDNQKPVIQGILDGTLTKENVSLLIVEENIKTITLNGVEVSSDQLVNISQDGNYNIVVIDMAYNQENIHFIIDKKVPVVQIITSNQNLPTNQNVIVTIKSNEIIKEVEGWTLGSDRQTLSKVFENNVLGNLIIEDLAGNQSLVNYQVVGIDRVFNDVMVTTSNDGKPTNQNVIVTIMADEPLQMLSGWTLSSDQKSLSKSFAEDINSFVIIKDLAGNSKNVAFQVTNIDKKIPAIAENNGLTYHIDANDNVVVTIRSNKPILTPEGWEIVDNPFVFSKVYKEDTQEVVILRDIYANYGSVIINVNKKEIVNNLRNPKKSIPKIVPSILNSFF